MAIISGSAQTAEASITSDTKFQGNGYYVNTVHYTDQFPNPSPGLVYPIHIDCTLKSDIVVGGGVVIFEPSVIVQRDHLKTLYSGPSVDNPASQGRDGWDAAIWSEASTVANSWDVYVICFQGTS